MGIDAVIPTFAEEKAKLKNKGMLIDDFDLLIGSTALYYGMTLVTENVGHLGRLADIEIENWINRHS